jgi:hypothetical protein
MQETLKKIDARLQEKQYKSQYKITGSDVSLVGLTTGGAATAAWIIELVFRVPVPLPVATFLGAVLGLAVARIFKP